MKFLAPWFVAIGAAIIVITSTVGGQRGAFVGKVSLAPYLYSYSIAAFAFIIAAILYYKQEGIPRIIPLRYDKGPTSPHQNADGQWCNPNGTIMSMADVLRAKHWINRYGLVFQNTGEQGFEIKPVNSVRVGTSTLVFDGYFPNWAQADGEGFFPINMERKDKSGLLGGLFEEMKDQDIDSIPIQIRYRNSKGHRYKTTCNVERDVMAPHGLTLNRIRHGRDLCGFLRRD